MMETDTNKQESLEDLLITLDQVQQTIEIMSIVVARLKQQITNNHEQEINSLFVNDELPSPLH